MPTPRDEPPPPRQVPPSDPAAAPGEPDPAGSRWGLDRVDPVDAGGEAIALGRLLEACQRRHLGAFNALYHRFAHAVHEVVLAAIGREEADDVTQEVFLKVHRGIGSVRDGQALPGWICSVARNAVVDFVRRQRRRPPPLGLVEEPAATVADAGAAELGDRVLDLIRQLPESYRETLVLRLVEGMTGPEIAARTGMTHGSVRVNLSRGMARLRSAMQGEGWS